MPSLTPAPAADAARAVLETVPLVMRAIRTRMREARPDSISIPQFRALLYIRRQPGTCGRWARGTGRARLVREDLVAREADASSRRRIRLTLSVAGLAQLDAAELHTTAWLVDVLGHLDAARLAVLVDGLRDLRAVVARDDGPPSAKP